MSLILFAPRLEKYVGRLLNLVAEATPGVEIEIHLTLESLVARMRRSDTESQVVILVTQTRRDLDGLLTMRHFLTDRHLILIVPDGEAATLSAGHRLRPRFLSVLEKGPQAVAAVATRLLRADRRAGARPERKDGHAGVRV
ncbi:MAG: hypothetical protein KJ621_06440 [Proteobacteria bacterium]|nr:hypothetical protein [Pseudomonadota bacterium]MBU1741788.1 hypothetical protein [Pseudomonadota bacterium]